MIEANGFIYGLDDIRDKVVNYCKIIIDANDDVKSKIKKLSITPTFLFYGLPGTGKTTLAYHIYDILKKDYNIDLEYLNIFELLSADLGQSSKNLQDFFEKIKNDQNENSSFTYVIIDELDSFTLNRYENDSEAMKRVLLSFNLTLDRMFKNGDLEKTIIVATTNLLEYVDVSVIRRFFFCLDFNIVLDKEHFGKYIGYFKENIQVLDFDENSTLEKLYKLYEEKQFTLGELKKIIAEMYMESIYSIKPEDIYTYISKQKSYYELSMEQKEVKHVR